MMNCYQCGGLMLDGKVPHEFVVSGVRIRGSIPAMVCSQCGESTVEADALKALDLAAALALAKSAVRTHEVFRFMRKALGMRAAELAELLVVDPSTISRWECKKQDVDLFAFALLADMVEDRIEGRTSTMDRLRRLAHPPTQFPPILDLSSPN